MNPVIPRTDTTSFVVEMDEVLFCVPEIDLDGPICGIPKDVIWPLCAHLSLESPLHVVGRGGDWKDLADYVGLPTIAIDLIKDRNDKTKAFTFFKLWDRGIKKNRGTVRKLIIALYEAGFSESYSRDHLLEPLGINSDQRVCLWDALVLCLVVLFFSLFFFVGCLYVAVGYNFQNQPVIAWLIYVYSLYAQLCTFAIWENVAWVNWPLTWCLHWNKLGFISSINNVQRLWISCKLYDVDKKCFTKTNDVPKILIMEHKQFNGMLR